MYSGDETFLKMLIIVFKSRDVLETLEELASLQNEVKELRFQDKVVTQNNHENEQKVFGPDIDTNKKNSEDMKKTIMLKSKENSEALANINNKF